MNASSCARASNLFPDHFEVHDLGFHLEQEIGVEVVIFGLGELIAREAPDCVLALPEGEGLDVDDVTFPSVEAPGGEIPDVDR